MGDPAGRLPSSSFCPHRQWNPSRVERKYRSWPSADHTGDPAGLAIAIRSPPARATWSRESATNAIQFPSGESRASTIGPLGSETIRRRSIVAGSRTSTVWGSNVAAMALSRGQSQTVKHPGSFLEPPPTAATTTLHLSSAYTTCVPSRDSTGLAAAAGRRLVTARSAPRPGSLSHRSRKPDFPDTYTSLRASLDTAGREAPAESVTGCPFPTARPDCGSRSTLHTSTL